MGFGFLGKNDNGVTQIDQDYMNLCFQSKFNVSNISAGTFGTWAGFEYAVDGNFIYYLVDYVPDGTVLAVRNSSNRPLAPLPLINETNSRNPPPSGYKRAVFFSPGTTSDTLTVYRFGNVPQSTPTGYGMVVKNLASQIVFNSQYPPMRMKQFVNLSGTSVGSSWTVNSSQTYAFVFANPTKGYYHPAGMTRAKMVALQQTNSTTIATAEINFYAQDAYSTGSLVDTPSIAAIVNVSTL